MKYDDYTVLYLENDLIHKNDTITWLKSKHINVIELDLNSNLDVITTHDKPSVIISNVNFVSTDKSGLQVNGYKIKKEIPIISLVNIYDLNIMFELVKSGFCNFVNKDSKRSILLDRIYNAFDELNLALTSGKTRIDLPDDSEINSIIIGDSPEIKKVKEKVIKLATSDASVIVYGETGTGKELVAKSLHKFSNRNKEAFVAINCASIPDELVESELFGHEKGSFTGAHKRRIGKFESSNRGTLLLDEIDSMPMSLQAKVLRVLEEKAIEPVGSNKIIPVDFRVVATSKVNLLNNNNFRYDLYYRLNMSEINIPPLRERVEDISILFNYFLKKLDMKRITNFRLSENDQNLLITHKWPGNARELKNIVTRLFLDSDLTLEKLLNNTLDSF